MKTTPARALLLACSLAASGSVLATDGITATSSQTMAQPYLGSEQRSLVNALVASRPGLQEGLHRLQPVLDWCDAKQSTADTTYVSVDNDAEAAEFRGQHPSLKNVVLIDAACPAAYKLVAFLYVDAKDFSAALAFLDKTVAIAPYFADAFTERGFILNQQGQPAAGADSYRQAIALLERHPNRQVQGVAYRGLGYSLVDLGELDAARQAYEASLKYDPDSKVAQSELEFVAGELKAKGGAQASPAGLVPSPSPGAVAAPSDDAQKAIALVHALEAEPLSDAAPAMRAWLIEWEAKTPEVAILVCDTTGLLSGKKSKYSAELMIQDMFGIAEWQLGHPGAWDDELAAQAAGVRSTLKAYAAIVAAQPKQHVDSLDALAAADAAGQLEAKLAPVVAKECSRKEAVPAPQRSN